ncbi:MAG: hypothetical protein MUO34_05325, partial [Ignavibacteriaceae bacterium]|nr:hypothetical protein [Ignavibacteriaceae bacterium]
VDININEIVPSTEDIILSQGIPKGSVIKENIKKLLDDSLSLFLTEAHPFCIIREISENDFGEIFIGEGTNEEEAPLKEIYPQADHLELFAVTMGSGISERITELFNCSDFAIGSMLDSVASLAADKSVALLEKHVTKKLIEKKMTRNSSMVLSYSPGYCGWHISAQKKLFLYLHPEQIGISLNESYLMTPLKSVTGVLINGNKNIHNFENSFSFCYNCKAQSCIERKERILSH